MSQALHSKGPVTRSAGLEAKEFMVEKHKSEGGSNLKSYSKEEVRVMQRSQLREFAKTVGVTTAGTDADVADRRISKFEDMRNSDSDVMMVESFCYVAFNGFPKRTDYSAAYHRINECIFNIFADVEVFVDVLVCTRALKWLV